MMTDQETADLQTVHGKPVAEEVEVVEPPHTARG
jgi:hypothetical protein